MARNINDKREKALEQVEVRILSWQKKIQDAHPMQPVMFFREQLEKAERERQVLQDSIREGKGKKRKPTAAEEQARLIRANYAEQESRRVTEFVQSTIDLNDWSRR